MKIEVSIGEIIDKWTILSIKKEKITDEAKLKNVISEFEYLDSIVKIILQTEEPLVEDLLQVNRVLWNVENNKRECEKNKDFGENFIYLARTVYLMNDRRAQIKKEINIKYNSGFIEEKSY